MAVFVTIFFFLASCSLLAQPYYTTLFGTEASVAEGRSIVRVTESEIWVVGNINRSGSKFTMMLSVFDAATGELKQSFEPLTTQNELAFSSYFRAEDSLIIVGGERYVSGTTTVGLLRFFSLRDSSWSEFTFPTSLFGGSMSIKGIAPGPDKSLYVAGNETVTVPGSSNLDMFAARIDSTNNILWRRTLSGSRTDYTQAVTVTKDSLFIVVGDTQSFTPDSSFSFSIIAYAFTATGDKQWETVIGDEYSNGSQRVRILQNGEIAIIGETTVAGRRGFDVVCSRIHPQTGEARWQTIPSLDASEAGFDMIELPEQNAYVFTGYRANFINAQAILLLKTDTNLRVLQRDSLVIGDLSVGYGIQALSPTAAVIVGKTTQPTNEVGVLHRFSLLTLSSLNERLAVTAEQTIRVAPNPAFGTNRLRFSGLPAHQVRENIEIYSATTGQLLHTGVLSSGKEIMLPSMNAGSYIARITSEGKFYSCLFTYIP